VKHRIYFKDGTDILFAPPPQEGLIVLEGDEDLPRLDAIGGFIRVYCSDGMQYLYNQELIRHVVSATNEEAEGLPIWD